jgi:hypothetical protein
MITAGQMVENQQVLLSYIGEINPEISNNLLRNIKNNISGFEEEEGSRKKVYKISVECLENICNHSNFINKKQPSIFILGKNETDYRIISGNYILKEEVAPLKEALDTINKLDKEKIKKKYRDVLSLNQISAKGGSGLGIIDIALKSEKKLEYRFLAESNSISFFILNIQIPRISKNVKSNEHIKN